MGGVNECSSYYTKVSTKVPNKMVRGNKNASCPVLTALRMKQYHAVSGI